MTAHDLVSSLHRKGFILKPLPGGLLEVRPKSKLTDALRDAIRSHKAGIIAALARPQEQGLLWQPARVLPPPVILSADADYWTVRFNDTLDAWQRKDWGPCSTCGQSVWYDHMEFSLCGICTPQGDYGRTVQ